MSLTAKDAINIGLGHQRGRNDAERTPGEKAVTKQVVYEFRVFPSAITGSISLPVAEAASQPLRARAIYKAPHSQKVKEVTFFPLVSATVTATETMAWHLLITKLGGSYGSATQTATYSLTMMVAGLSSGTDKAGTHSGSWSDLDRNVAEAPNRMHLQRGAGFGRLDTAANGGKVVLGKGDILRAQVLKGSGSANDSGAVFRGGTLILEVEDI